MKHPSDLHCADTDQGLGSTISELRRGQEIPQQSLRSSLEDYGTSMGAAALSRWENGSNLPGCYQLLSVSHALGENGRLARLAPSGSFAAHPSPVREEAGDTLSGFLLHQEASASARRRRRIISFPLADELASAGTGYPLADGNFSFIDLPAESIPPRATFAVHISGDSMEPRYHDGDLVFVEKTSRLRDGEIGVFSLDGDGYIKQYHEQILPPDEAEDDFYDDGRSRRTVSLVSCNPRYKPIPVCADSFLVVFGRVL